MDSERGRFRRAPRVGAALLAPLAVGWLASGSCTIAACYEECDPCWQTCQCSRVCANPVAGARITAYRSRVAESSGQRFVREIEVEDGPVAPADPDAGPEALVAFARRVLDANTELFTAEREPRWSLQALQAYPDLAVAHFALEAGAYGPRHANSVSLLFDARGRLLAATHVVERRTD